MDKNSLEISQASDLQSAGERTVYRLFELLPGLLSWGTLGGAFFFSWYRPAWAAIFIILFCIFWLCKIIYLSYHQFLSFKKMKKHLAIDWRGKLNQLPNNNWQDIYQLVILPAYKEGEQIIRSSCQSLLEADYPQDKIIVILSYEAKAGKEARKTAQVIKREYEQKFGKFLITFHPHNLPGEMAGKGSNVAWALKYAEKEIKDIPHENILVSTFDTDTKIYPQYFTCLTWHYLTAAKPFRSSFQPIPVYNNNIWEAIPFARVIATSNTFWQMMQQERQQQLVTYSSHSVPFNVLKEVGYPANVVPDDSRVFWKAFFHYEGDYQTVPLHYPVSMDMVMAESWFKTVVNQYKQQRRWAWGCMEIPFIIYGLLKNKKIPLSKKLYYIFNVLDGFWSWAVAALLIFCLGWLPLTLGGEEFNTTLLSYNLPKITGVIMGIAMFGMLFSAVLSVFLLPRRPQRYGKIKSFFVALQWLLLPITLIVFGAFPALDAQTRLLLGKYMGFWSTDKIRK
ncbi:MAG: glycosyltransferase family 2 protein [bacterium]